MKYIESFLQNFTKTHQYLECYLGIDRSSLIVLINGGMIFLLDWSGQLTNGKDCW